MTSHQTPNIDSVTYKPHPYYNPKSVNLLQEENRPARSNRIDLICNESWNTEKEWFHFKQVCMRFTPFGRLCTMQYVLGLFPLKSNSSHLLDNIHICWDGRMGTSRSLMFTRVCWRGRSVLMPVITSWRTFICLSFCWAAHGWMLTQNQFAVSSARTLSIGHCLHLF